MEKMHATNRVKHEEAVRIQNEGLKQELEGYEFKPNINKVKNKMYSGENGRFARSGNIWERLQRVSVVLLLAAQIQKLAGTR